MVKRGLAIRIEVMMLSLFFQSTMRGGLDTFAVNLILAFPKDMPIKVYCNVSHDGLDGALSGITNVEIIKYDFLLGQDIASKFGSSWLGGIVKTIYWLFGLPYLIWHCTQLFKRDPSDAMLIINGGYPGGDACIAATVAWRLKHRRRPVWHNFHNLVRPYPVSLFRSLKERLIDRCVAWAATGFVTVSKACLATLDRRTVFSQVQKCYIYNGMDVDRIGVSEPALRRDFGIPEGAPLIVYPAVFEPRKGHDFLIEAMETVSASRSDAFLLIIGDGSPAERSLIKEKCRSSLCSDKIVIGQHRSDLISLLGQADLVVMASQDFESFGYAAAEASLAGVPVVATDVGGLSEVVEDGITGFIVSKTDVSAFANAILNVLNDNELRVAMGSAGKRRAKELFNAINMANAYFNLLSSSNR